MAVQDFVRLRRALCCAATALVLTATGGLARAQEATPEVRLSWVRGAGAESCLDARDLAARVKARLGRDPFDDHAEVDIEGTASRGPDGFRAELYVRDAHQQQIGRRELVAAGDSCAPLANAVALAVALTIDPNAAAYAAAEPGRGATSPRATDAPQALWTDEAVLPCPPAPSCPVAPPCPRCEERARTAARADVLASALVAFGLLPGTAVGASLAASYGSERVRGTLGLAWLPERELSTRPFAFGLTTGRVGACGAPLVASRTELWLCAGVEVGAIHAVVRQLTPLRPGEHLWLAAAAGPSVSYKGFAPLKLEVGAQAIVPLRRNRFAVEGEAEPAFESAIVGGVAHAGVGLDF